MSARKIQIGQDIVKYANIMNDLLDVASMHMKEIAEDTGGKYQVIDKTKSTIESLAFKDASFEELRDRVQKDCRNALAYKVTLDNYIASMDKELLADCLSKFNISLESIQSDTARMEQVCKTVLSKIANIKNKAELKTIATDIDSKIEPLKLIRRPWCLEK